MWRIGRIGIYTSMEAAITIISFARRTIVSVSVRVGTDIKILAIGCHVVMPSGLDALLVF